VARELKEAFGDMDKNNDGTLDASEFRSAMRVLRVELERDDVSIIFKRYADGDKMNYDDFLRLVDFAGTNGGSGRSAAGASRRPKATLREVEKIADEVRRRLEDYLGTGSGVVSRVKHAFSDIDRDDSGDVDKKEFSAAMKTLRADVSAEDVDTLFDYYDANGSRGLDYSEFIRLLGFDSRDRDRDSARGSARRGEEKMR
jgi:Ca2+-binding EF-hand superfamily protein